MLKIIPLKQLVVFSAKNTATVVHELLITMSLHHTFDNDATYGYKKEATFDIRTTNTGKNMVVKTNTHLAITMENSME
ncbi:hypothetical protein ACJRPK_04905 [Aquimarina sp. 2-A2]|uniref:hypothetical protein n=1 Tax=Aquimarina sp. 2-A2 TaxID=3382644 RepID=UPI00387F0A76